MRNFDEINQLCEILGIVYLGTAFLATTESRMADNVKQMLVNSTADDLHLFRTLPAFYRSIPTPHSAKLVAMSEAGANREEIAKVMNGGVGMRKGMLEGNLDEGYISVDNGVTLIKQIRPVQALIEDLMQDFRQLQGVGFCSIFTNFPQSHPLQTQLPQKCELLHRICPRLFL